MLKQYNDLKVEFKKLYKNDEVIYEGDQSKGNFHFAQP